MRTMTKNRISRTFAYILHQIWNEKRSNSALFAELLIVGCIVWYLVDSAFVIVSKRTEPTGFDATNCYRIEMGYLTEGSVGYDPVIGADTTHSIVDDRLALLDRIRHDEDIEAAAYSMRNDPYNGSSMQCICEVDTFKIETRIICCDPDFLRVFRYTGVDGQTPEKLASMLKDRNVFLSYNNERQHKQDWHKFLNKPIKALDDSVPFRLVALVNPAKRFTWEERTWNDIVILRLSPWDLNQTGMINLSIRVKESKMPGFEERFKEKIKNKKMRAGNMYVSDITSYDTLRQSTESGENAKLRNSIVCIGFLLVNVFLGLLGTFWFRTQHRFPEIGLQKAIGATNKDITLRLFSEAAIIMTLAFVVSLIIDANIAYAHLTQYYMGETLTTSRFITCALISYFLMLLIIALGIWMPAFRAAKTSPVDVLRGE